MNDSRIDPRDMYSVRRLSTQNPAGGASQRPSTPQKSCRFETLESRLTLSADVGLVASDWGALSEHLQDAWQLAAASPSDVREVAAIVWNERPQDISAYRDLGVERLSVLEVTSRSLFDAQTDVEMETDRSELLALALYARRVDTLTSEPVRALLHAADFPAAAETGLTGDSPEHLLLTLPFQAMEHHAELPELSSSKGATSAHAVLAKAFVAFDPVEPESATNAATLAAQEAPTAPGSVDDSFDVPNSISNNPASADNSPSLISRQFSTTPDEREKSGDLNNSVDLFISSDQKSVIFSVASEAEEVSDLLERLHTPPTRGESANVAEESTDSPHLSDSQPQSEGGMVLLPTTPGSVLDLSTIDEAFADCGEALDIAVVDRALMDAYHAQDFGLATMRPITSLAKFKASDTLLSGSQPTNTASTSAPSTTTVVIAAASTVLASLVISRRKPSAALKTSSSGRNRGA